MLFACGAVANAFSQTCDCAAAFDFAKKKVEANYAGMIDKVTPSNRSYYNSFSDSVRSLSLEPQNQQQTECAKVLSIWLAFFKDGHLGLNFNSVSTSGNKDSIRMLFAGTPKAIYTAESFHQYLLKNKSKLKPLEGIWRNEAGNYTVGIWHDDNKYTGFILKADSVYWLPGQIKMEISEDKDSVKSNFYMRDHSMQLANVNIDDLDNGHIEIEKVGGWYKLDEAGNMIYKNYYPNSSIVNFKRLSTSTNLLTIKSFDGNFRRTIDSIVTANDQLIQSTGNLIIDVRGNGGGSDISYYPIRKYLFTNPYTRYKTEIYCTNDNIQKFRDLASDKNYSPQEQEEFKKMVASMEQHLNEYWSSSPLTFSSDTLEVLVKPKKIGVIIDGFCGSTTEQFLLDPVSNSKKTTIYGTHSGGVLDYANLTSFSIPGTTLGVHYPTSRSKRIDLGKGIDNKGIQPHVQLDNTVGDWIKYVQKDLEK